MYLSIIPVMFYVSATNEFYIRHSNDAETEKRIGITCKNSECPVVINFSKAQISLLKLMFRYISNDI